MTTAPDTPEATENAAKGPARNLARAFAILDTVAGRSEGATLSELARDTGMPEPTAHRLLRTLESFQLVRGGQDGHYLTGRRWLDLGSAYLAAVPVGDDARTSLEWLAESTGETAHLGVLDGDRVIYVEKVDSPRAVRMHSAVGRTNPAATTALGRAILAHSGAAAIEEIISSGAPARTPRTLVDPAALRAELARTRERGYAIDDVENEDDIRCVAAAVLDSAGAPLAAVSLTAPAHRVTRDDLTELAPTVMECAGRLSRDATDRNDQ